MKYKVGDKIQLEVDIDAITKNHSTGRAHDVYNNYNGKICTIDSIHHGIINVTLGNGSRMTIYKNHVDVFWYFKPVFKLTENDFKIT